MAKRKTQTAINKENVSTKAKCKLLCYIKPIGIYNVMSIESICRKEKKSMCVYNEICMYNVNVRVRAHRVLPRALEEKSLYPSRDFLKKERKG